MTRPRGGTGALTQALVKLVTEKGGIILTEQAVKEVLIDGERAVGVRVEGGKEYRASRGVISNIDARRLFLQMVDAAAIDAADPKLRERLERKIANNNEAILKIDCALSEVPRFEGHNHKDENLIGSILIADSTDHVEKSHAMTLFGEMPDADPSMTSRKKRLSSLARECPTL